MEDNLENDYQADDFDDLYFDDDYQADEFDDIYMQYAHSFNDACMPRPAMSYGPLGLVHIETNTALSGAELAYLFKQFGGPLAVYKECLAKNISWKTLLGVRKYTKEEWLEILEGNPQF